MAIFPPNMRKLLFLLKSFDILIIRIELRKPADRKLSRRNVYIRRDGKAA